MGSSLVLPQPVSTKNKLQKLNKLIGRNNYCLIKNRKIHMEENYVESASCVYGFKQIHQSNTSTQR